MTEYLVLRGDGKWEICIPGVFYLPCEDELQPRPDKRYKVAWANRDGAFFCENGDVIEVKELES